MNTSRKLSDQNPLAMLQINELDAKSPGSAMQVLTASVKAKGGKIEGRGFRHALTFRMSPSNYVTLEAIHERSRLNRNEILDQVVSIGFTYFLDHLDDDTRAAIDDLMEAQGKKLAKAVHEVAGGKDD